MCGIVAVYTNNNEPVIHYTYQSLKKLEYRGYDSSGIGYIDNNILKCIKKTGSVDNLLPHLNSEIVGNLAIGHTRWATHGKVNETNAHPFIHDNVAIAVNGVVENYSDLQNFVNDNGYVLSSETDVEVILFLYHIYRDLDTEARLSKILSLVKGNYSFVILDGKDNLICGVKNGLQLVIGFSHDKESYLVASDKHAFPEFINNYINLTNGDLFIINYTGLTLINRQSNVSRETLDYYYDDSVSDMQGFDTYMLKEIFEQPYFAKNNLEYYLNNQVLNNLSNHIDSSVCLIACGSSYYAAMQFSHWVENNLNIEIKVFIASEFIFSNSKREYNCYLLISQSGETKDTLMCADLLKSKKAKIISIVNNAESSLAELSDMVLPINAGKEVAVASTKALFNQILTLYFIYASKIKLKLNDLSNDLYNFSNLNFNNLKIDNIINLLNKSKKIILSSRSDLLPITYEISLKIKELSYRQVEVVPSGELKHGSISVVDNNTAMIFLIDSSQYSVEKTIININEVKLRGAITIVICDKSLKDKLTNIADCICIIEKYFLTDNLNVLNYLVTGQFIAYKFAESLCNNIDMPRNLAKSVTVE